MSEEKCLQARMFFTNGKIETRPVDWIVFTTAGEFMMDEPEMKEQIEGKIKKYGEMYIGFIDQITGIQIFRGCFTNVREKNHNRTQRHN